MNDDKKPEIIFAPGCFDNFEGTQEELQDLLAEIHQMVESGELFEKAERLTPEEEEEMRKLMEERGPRQ